MSTSGDIPQPLRVAQMTPLDDKNQVSLLSDLKNLGTKDNKAFTYYRGMIIYCHEDKKRYEWTDDLTDKKVLLEFNFKYPRGTYFNNINYSNLEFNFIEFEASSDSNFIIFEKIEDYEQYLLSFKIKEGQLVVNPDDGLYYTVVYDSDLNEYKYELFEVISVIEEDIKADLTVGGVEAGQIVPEGITLTQAFKLLLSKVFKPTYISPSFSMTNNAGIKEVGQTFNITVTGNFNRGQIKGANVNGVWDQNAIQNPRSGESIQYSLGGVFSISNTRTYSITATSSTIHIEGSVDFSRGPDALNSNNEIVDFLEAGSLIASTSFIGYYRRYAGPVSSIPLSGSQIRTDLLSTSVLNTSNTFSFNTGTVNKIFIISFPSNKKIKSVINSGTNEDLTAAFVLSTTLTTVPDAGGNLVNSRVYIMENVIPFSSDYQINITIENS